uniref:Uncharacterized protein n=1 Tax=Romanomermis culicivorax TaxID=13658 RepID=A0A915L7Z9_ROMCU
MLETSLTFKLDLETHETFFEKVTSILGANFRYESKFYFENSRENFIWWTQLGVDHILNTIFYDAKSNSILVKKIMQDGIFYDMSKNPSFQILDWYVAKALAYVVALYRKIVHQVESVFDNVTFDDFS